MNVLVFDLDDTLYDELTYVKSGFQAVADYLQHKYMIDSQGCFQWMWERLQYDGRGRIFDDTLIHFNFYSKSAVNKCLRVYRTHQPKIKLNEESKRCVSRLQNYPQYIVTDGNKTVQHNKLVVLGLYKEMKHCFVTHRYGVKHAKPSAYCFFKIAEREEVTPDKIAYIADNPHKDFVGIKKHGFKTVRLMRGQYKDIEKTKQYEADYRITSLDELDDYFLDRLFTQG
jgi:putative hydrolase of the HAD superfamily